MRFFNRLILVSSSMLASLLIMFSFNPSYRSSFNRIIREFFDKNYLFDSYGQKILIDETKPVMVLFSDLGDQELRDYFYENLSFMYLINKFMEKNFEIPVYLISAKSRNNSDNLKLLKEYANYYFFSPFSPGKSRFGTEESSNLRKKLSARDKMIAFISPSQQQNEVKNENDNEKEVEKNSQNLAESSISSKSRVNLLWDLENQGALLKEIDELCISARGVSLFEPFLPKE